MDIKKGIIKVTKNGPLMVTGVHKLKNPIGQPISCKPTMALCRCGGSSNKPFCNGTHMRNGFNGDRTSDLPNDEVKVYKGKNITIFDNRKVCAHRGHCTEDLPSVFNHNQKPWINPDGASVEEIIDLCSKCPSGALSYALPGGERINHIEDRNQEIALSPRHFDFDGPYDVVGEIKLEDKCNCKPESEEHYTLCRCGASKNKPFCSGEHWHVKFIDEDSLKKE